MNELIKQLSSYKIFNYLIPGIIYVIFVKETTSYNLIQDNILVGFVLYYFIGMTISRIGSLIIEPILKWIKFIKFEPYEKYHSASQKDNKAADRLEDANTYRTLISVFICILTTKLAEYLCGKFGISTIPQGIVLICLLFILYGFAYRKQVRLLVKRIIIANDVEKQQ